MKVTKTVFGVAMLALASLSACKNTNFKKTKDGMLYTVKGEGKGDTIAAGNVIRIHITRKLGDSLLGTTYGLSPETVPIPRDAANNEMFKIFFSAHKGDSILLLQPVDSIMAKDVRAAKDSLLMANKGKNFETILKIVDVYKDAESASASQRKVDEAAIEKYLKEKNIQTVRSPKGVYVQTITPGNGQLPKAGQEVSLRYTGKTLDGRTFDGNTQPGAPLLPVQIGAGGTIPGFEDGVAQLSKGQKAVIFIPSTLGYGQQAPPAIGPDKNLMFELEVVDIKDKAAMPPPPPPTAMNGMVDSTSRPSRK